MEEERWLPIKGWEDYYECSSWGRIRSKERIIIQNNGRFHRRKSQLLSLIPNKKVGYLQVMLHNHQKYKLCYVHRVVCQAFVENPYGFDYVTHLNGNDHDNRAVNLRWISKSWKKNKELNLI